MSYQINIGRIFFAPSLFLFIIVLFLFPACGTSSSHTPPTTRSSLLDVRVEGEVSRGGTHSHAQRQVVVTETTFLVVDEEASVDRYLSEGVQVDETYTTAFDEETDCPEGMTLTWEPVPPGWSP